jgi:hypothetical protein
VPGAGEREQGRVRDVRQEVLTEYLRRFHDVVFRGGVPPHNARSAPAVALARLAR